MYARNLIDKILFHVGYDDAEAWKVIISNDSHEAQMIVPFPISYSHRAHLQSESNNEVVVFPDSHRDKKRFRSAARASAPLKSSGHV